MPRFRKRPVEIEAYHYSSGAALELDKMPDWLTQAIRNGKVFFYMAADIPHVTIMTLEGNLRANEGDWIIRGVAGELYPCKPDIFAVTYDPVE